MIYHTEEELIKASGPEKWRHFIINTGSEYKLHDWYSISTHGRVASHIARRHKGKGLRGYDRVIDHNKQSSESHITEIASLISRITQCPSINFH